MQRVNAAIDSTPFPVGCNSWYRDRLSNQAAEGKDYSQHLVGLAVDLRAPADKLDDLRRALEWRGLTCVSYRSHVHAQYWRAGRLEAFVKATPTLATYVG
jgi:hypothetical protein